jgi:hypothetical protein
MIYVYVRRCQSAVWDLWEGLVALASYLKCNPESELARFEDSRLS